MLPSWLILLQPGPFVSASFHTLTVPEPLLLFTPFFFFFFSHSLSCKMTKGCGRWRNRSILPSAFPQMLHSLRGSAHVFWFTKFHESQLLALLRSLILWIFFSAWGKCSAAYIGLIGTWWSREILCLFLNQFL